MTPQTAEAYRSLQEEHLAGTDLVGYLDGLFESYHYELTALNHPNDILRCQGKLQALKDVRDRFILAQKIREDVDQEKVQ